MMTVQTRSVQNLVRLIHKDRVVNGSWQLDMAEMTRTGKVGQMTAFTPA
jgi:hypothetical protein